MRLTPVFLGMVSKGKLVFNNPDGMERYLLGLDNKSVEVVIRLPRKDRTNQENRYYFGVVVKLISEHTGFSVDEVHEFLKLKFLSKIIVMAGEDVKIPRSSTELSTVEWEQWMTEIREWAAMVLGLYIPLPNEIDLDNL